MAKPSKKRLGLLRFISDKAGSGGYIYFPAYTNLQLEKYDLTVWDTAIITFAEKAGLIKRKHSGSFGRLTKEGKQLLKQWRGKTD